MDCILGEGWKRDHRLSGCLRSSFERIKDLADFQFVFLTPGLRVPSGLKGALK